MTPHLVKWHEKYSQDGLTIIEVFNGSVDRQFGLDVNAVQDHIRTKKVPFAVLYDADGTFCNRYGIKGYPIGYLIGSDGRVIWEDAPHGNQRRVERKIRRAL
jgi:hypothetical protein